jgi:hypothetical protein
MNRIVPWLLLCCLAGCSRQSSSVLPASTAVSQTTPVFADLELFIELRQSHAGASVESRTYPNVAMLAENPRNSIAGACSLSDGTSVHANLRYLDSTPGNDRYSLTIKRDTTHGNNTTSASREQVVVFNGSAREVSADGQCRIVLQPSSELSRRKDR